MKIPLDPDVAATAPSSETLTAYDIEHAVTHVRLLDAEADGADSRDVARIVLHLVRMRNCVAGKSSTTLRIRFDASLYLDTIVTAAYSAFRRDNAAMMLRSVRSIRRCMARRAPSGLRAQISSSIAR